MLVLSGGWLISLGPAAWVVPTHGDVDLLRPLQNLHFFSETDDLKVSWNVSGGLSFWDALISGIIPCGHIVVCVLAHAFLQSEHPRHAWCYHKWWHWPYVGDRPNSKALWPNAIDLSGFYQGNDKQIKRVRSLRTCALDEWFLYYYLTIQIQYKCMLRLRLKSPHAKWVKWHNVHLIGCLSCSNNFWDLPQKSPPNPWGPLVIDWNQGLINHIPVITRPTFELFKYLKTRRLYWNLFLVMSAMVRVPFVLRLRGFPRFSLLP